MSKFKLTHSLINKLTNIYKLGGVNFSRPDSSCDDINPSTHTCGRLFARAVQRVAFVVSLLFLLGACQQAYLIPDEETEESTRSTDEEALQDSTNVNIDFDTKDWEGSTDVTFSFGGEEQE